MSQLKSLPWVSLALVLITYSTLGWVTSEAQTLYSSTITRIIPQENAPWIIWPLLVVAVILLVKALTTPWHAIAKHTNVVVQSNLKSFTFAVLGAFMFFLIIALFKVFLYTLLLVSVTILARIDFQVGDFNEKQAFIITSIFALLGLVVGAVVEQLIQ
jgi:hypothetical protein